MVSIVFCAVGVVKMADNVKKSQNKMCLTGSEILIVLASFYLVKIMIIRSL